MPIFNVIRINQTQVAKVKVARQNLPEPSMDETINISDFQRWRNYIRKEVKNTGKLPTTVQMN